MSDAKKVKMFDYSNVWKLEDAINEFLSNENIYVIEIQYRPTSRSHSTDYTAMIIYKEKES